MFSKILKILKELNCKTVLGSLIPSPISHHICHSDFYYVNKKLEKLCQKFSDTSFMNLDDIFLKENNIKMSYIKNDKVHLNTKGTKALAKEIKSQLSSF